MEDSTPLVRHIPVIAVQTGNPKGIASPADLAKVPGVGENTVVLLKLIPAVAARYLASRTSADVIISDSASLRTLFLPYFFGARNEMSFLACFDGKLKLLGVRLLSEGSPSANEISLRKIATEALALGATAVVLAATLVDHFLDFQVDGLAGLLVAAFILKTGWEAAKDTLDPLLGRAMDPELAADIDKLVLSHPNILDIHDLVYHDYGPGRAMMSFHAEVPADADLLEMHDIIDHIERELKAKHHIETVIHTDPVVNDERTNALREQVEAAAKALDPALSIHDLRITAGPYHTNVLFDVMVPYGFRLTDAQVTRELRQAVEALSEKYSAVIQVDHSYVERREDV